MAEKNGLKEYLYNKYEIWIWSDESIDAKTYNFTPKQIKQTNN